MVGSTAADQSASAVTEATDQHKQKGRKPAKTRAEKDAHNARCVKYRQKIKMRSEELGKVEIKYFEMVPKFNQMQAENQRIKTELNEKNYKILCMGIENQQLRRALERQAADQARMRLIPTGWNIINGRNFNNFDEWVAWFASQTYDAAGPSLDQFASYFVGSPNMIEGPDFTNMAATAAGPSLVVNYGLPSASDAPSNHVNNDHFPHELAVGNKAGFLSNSGAGSSFAANSDLPMLDSPNNHDDDLNSDLFSQHTDTGSLFWENPSSKAA